MMKLKELLKNSKDNSIKTHIVVNGYDGGITGFYSAEWLIENYGECESKIEEYEKDYGEGAIAIMRYLAVYVEESK